MSSIWFWIFSTLFWTFVMSFYSMQEMACISFNRLRLEFAVRQGSKRASYIKAMLDNPLLLFSTTLIGVNLSLVLSSESMRRVFSGLQINPNYSPIIEAPYMIICGELIPMFAARLFPEHMARIGIPFLWASSKVLYPITLIIKCSVASFHRLFTRTKTRTESPRLQSDELRELLAKRSKSFSQADSSESMVGQIFHLKEQSIAQIMLPIQQFPIVKSSFFVHSAQELLRERDLPFALVQNRANEIIGYIHIRDLVFTPPKSTVGSILKSPTFISAQTNIIDAFFAMRKEGSYLTLIVGSGGEIAGLTTIDTLLANFVSRSETYLLHIEKTVPADLRVDEFLQKYHLILPTRPDETFGELVERLLGHKPSLHDSAHLGPLEIIVKEVSIRGAKSVLVKTNV